MRAAFRRVPQPQWKDLVQGFSQGLNFGGTVSDVNASSPEATDGPFHFSYNYARKDYPDWPTQLSAPLPPTNMAKLDDNDKNLEPIKLETPGDFVLDATVRFPSKVTPQGRAAVDFKKDFAEYHASYSAEAGVLHVQRRLSIKMREIPRARSEEYRAFWKEVNDDQQFLIQLQRSAAALRHAWWRIYKSIESVAAKFGLRGVM